MIPRYFYLVAVSEEERNTIDFLSVPREVRPVIEKIFEAGDKLLCISQGPSKAKKIFIKYTDDGSISKIISDKNDVVYYLVPYDVVISSFTRRRVGNVTKPVSEETVGIIYGARAV